MARKNLDWDELTAMFFELSNPLDKYVVRFCQNPNVADHVVGDAFARLAEEYIIGEGPTPVPRLFLYQTVYDSIHGYSHDSRYSSWADPVVIRSEGDDLPFSKPLEGEPVPEEVLFAALHDELTEDERHVLSLYYVDGFSLKDTAIIAGKEVSEVKASLKGIRMIMNGHPELQMDSLTHKKKHKRK